MVTMIVLALLTAMSGLLVCLTGCAGAEEAPEIPDCLIDLHLHLDGSLSVASARKLAAMQGIDIPADDEELLDLLTVSADCRDLNEYLEKFDFPCSLLQTREALAEAVCTLEEELQAQGLIYAEIRFAPQKHRAQGLTQEDVVLAAIEGAKRCGFRSNLILCCMRGADNAAENSETIRLAAKYLGQGVCAADLAGAEALFPTSDYASLFDAAKAAGLPFTLHAGEADGPESVWKALEFGAARIGHGVRSIEDPALAARLAADGIPLELCPTSNLNTAVYPDLSQYPLAALMEQGVKVTVNTDNMSVSGTTLRREYQRLMDEAGLTEEQLYTLLRNAVDAAFADEATKTELRAAVEAAIR